MPSRKRAPYIFCLLCITFGATIGLSNGLDDIKDRINQFYSIFGRSAVSRGIPLRGGLKEPIALNAHPDVLVDEQQQHHQHQLATPVQESATESYENARFVLPPREPRIYAQAPSGVGVTKVRAIYNSEKSTSVSVNECDPKYYLFGAGSSSKLPQFSVDECEGLIQTARYVEKEVGDSYHLGIVAVNQDGHTVATLLLAVEVTLYNKHSPFLTGSYSSQEVVENAELGSLMMTLKADDRDIEKYNNEVFFLLQDPSFAGKDPWLFPTTFPLNISFSTGEIRFSGDLKKLQSSMQFHVGVADGGSPQRSQVTIMTLLIRKMSAPRNVSVHGLTKTAVDLCWSPPEYGTPKGYIITYNHSGQLRNLNVTEKDIKTRIINGDVKGQSPVRSKLHCFKLNDLLPYTHYVLNIRAWNSDGFSTMHQPPLTIFTKNPVDCRAGLCGHGVCQEKNSSPGYFCICAKGYYGAYCELEDPCSEGSCEEQCQSNDNPCLCTPASVEGNCTFSERCLSHPSCYIVEECTEDFFCYCNIPFGGESCKLRSRAKIKDTSSCVEDTTSLPEGDFAWPETLLGGTIILPCPYGTKEASRKARSVYSKGDYNEVDYEVTLPSRLPSRFPRSTEDMAQYHENDGDFYDYHWQSYDTLSISESAIRKCIKSHNAAIWLPPDVSACKIGFGYSIEYGNGVDTEDTSELLLVTSSKNMSEETLGKTVHQLTELADKAYKNHKAAEKMVKVISNLLSGKSPTLKSEPTVQNASDTMLRTINAYTSKVQLNPGENITLKAENLVVETRLLRKEDIVGDVTFEPPPDLLGDGRETDDPTISTEPNEGKMILKIPKEILKRVAEKNVRFQFVSFKDDRIFTSKEGHTFLNMPVISASLGQEKISNLKVPIVYSIPVKKTRLQDAEPRCVFWDEEDTKWKSDGLKLTTITSDKVTCESNHLTAFSILLDPVAKPIDGTHGVILSLITYIGLVLSTAALIATIATFALFRSLNRDRSGVIVMNLSLALLFLNIGFIGASAFSADSKACIPFAAFLHYAVIASFCWMLVEAVNMHQLLVTVFPSVETHFMVKRVLFGWGTPVILVAIALVWNHGVYIHTTMDFCVISPTSVPAVYYVTYLTPICLILFINCVVFMLVTKVLCRRRPSSNKHKESPEKPSHKRSPVTVAQIRGAVTVVALLGVTWIAGAFSLGSFRTFFQYFFCITTPLQGFIIFFVRVIQSAEARAAWYSFITTGSRSRRHKHRPLSSVRTHSSTQNSTSLNTQSTGMTPPKSAFASAMRMARRLSLVTGGQNSGGISSSNFFTGRGKGLYGSWSSNSSKKVRKTSANGPTFEDKVDGLQKAEKVYQKVDLATHGAGAEFALSSDEVPLQISAKKSLLESISMNFMTKDTIRYETNSSQLVKNGETNGPSTHLIEQNNSYTTKETTNEAYSLPRPPDEGNVIPLKEFVRTTNLSSTSSSGDIQDPFSEENSSVSILKDLSSQSTLLLPSVKLPRTKSDLQISIPDKLLIGSVPSSRRALSNDDLHLITPMMSGEDFKTGHAAND